MNSIDLRLLAALLLMGGLTSGIARSQDSGSQEDAVGLGFVTVVNATGLEGDLQVRVNGKNPVDGVGYTSGSDTGQIGFKPGPITVEAAHPACPKPAKSSVALQNESNVFLLAYVKEEENEDGEVVYQLGIGKLPHRPSPGETRITVFACDPDEKIGSVVINGTDLPVPPLEPVRFLADYDDVLSVKGAGGGELEPYLINYEEHHYLVVFPTIGEETDMQGTWLLDEKIVYTQEAEARLLREAREREEKKKQAMEAWLQSQEKARERYLRSKN